MTRPPLAVLWRESHATSAVLAGAAASLPAAALSALAMGLLDRFAGRPPWTMIRDIGATVTGGGGAEDTLGAGMAAHAATSLVLGVAWGVLVAFTAHHIAPVAGAIWGALYGLAIWFVAFFVVLPWTEESLSRTPARIGLLWHAVYGATLGILFHYARLRAERKRHRLPPEQNERPNP